MILHHLADLDLLSASFGVDTVHRAHGYVDTGAILEVVVSSTTARQLTAVARVPGAARTPYTVELEAFAHATKVAVATWCSCPVGYHCKRGATLALHLARTRPGPATAPSRPPSWRDQLDGVLTDLAELAPREVEHTALALHFTFDDNLGNRHYYSTDQGPTIRVRPMRQGKRGWVKNGVDWHELVHAPHQRAYRAEQLEALGVLHHSLGTHYWYRGVERSLSEFGTQIVRQLRDAANCIVLYTDLPLMETSCWPRPRPPRPPTSNNSVDVPGWACWSTVDSDAASRAMLFGSLPTARHFVDDGRSTITALADPLPAPVVSGSGRDPVMVPVAEAAACPTTCARLRGLVPAPPRASGSVDLPASWCLACGVTVAWRLPRPTWPGRGSRPRARPSRAARCGRRRAVSGACAPPPSNGSPSGSVLSSTPTDRHVDSTDAVSLALLELPPSWRRSREL